MKAMQIKTLLIENTFMGNTLKHGFGNGYIGVPKGHPWFEKGYDDIDCDVHGGLTYAEDRAPLNEPDGYWWIGFDTAHYRDTQGNYDKAYCLRQIESMKQQALLAS